MPPETDMDTTCVLLEHRQWLWSVVYARVGDQSATEDVLQEVSLAALLNDKRGYQIREIKAWLYQVAIRQALLFRRSQARQRGKIRKFADSGLVDTTSVTVDGIVASEETELVRSALAELSARDRQVLLLKYQDNLSCKEIAAVCRVTESTIQSRLLRARRRMRSSLERSNFAGEDKHVQ
ncbi:MAG: sigma-70 family RNA polymerase sigma factor [Pirellulaceae bacterium]